MNLITIIDHKHHKIMHIPESICTVLFHNKKLSTLSYILKSIKKCIEADNFEEAENTSPTGKILNYIFKNKVITTTIAKSEGLITQSNQLQQSIEWLRGKKYDIGIIKEVKPFIYYYGIDKKDAILISCSNLLPHEKDKIRKYVDNYYSIVMHGRMMMGRGKSRGMKTFTETGKKKMIKVEVEKLYSGVRVIRLFDIRKINKIIESNKETEAADKLINFLEGD